MFALSRNSSATIRRSAALRRNRRRTKLCPMELRIDLLEHLTDEDIMASVLENNHRYKPELLFFKNRHWESVTGFNRGACARGGTQHGPNPEGYETTRCEWEEWRGRESTLPASQQCGQTPLIASSAHPKTLPLTFPSPLPETQHLSSRSQYIHLPSRPSPIVSEVPGYSRNHFHPNPCQETG